MKKRKKAEKIRKKINKKNNTYLLIIIILLLFAFATLWIRTGLDYHRETIRIPIPSPTPKIYSFNFSETGYISDYDTLEKEETGEWFFLYENPGIPIIKVKLEFTKKSICDFAQGEKTCDTSKLISGTKIKIEGLMQIDKLIVSKITRVNY